MTSHSTEWRRSHPERAKVQNREALARYRAKKLLQLEAYRAEHADEIRVQEQERQRLRLEAKRRAKKIYRKAHPEKKREQERRLRAKRRLERDQYDAAHPEIAAAKDEERRRKRVEKKKRKRHKRRAAERNAGGRLSPGITARLHRLQRGKCPVCMGKLGKYHIDHVQPLARGGMNTDDNVQLLCGPCNRAKSHKSPLVFMQERGFLL